ALNAVLTKRGGDPFVIDVSVNAIADIQATELDRAFRALHGPGGEDGRIQAVLEYLQIPYTGSDVQSSALAMDKLRSKHLWRGMGLSTPDYATLRRDSDWAEVLQSLGGDVMVKPAHEGSSIGMSRVQSVTELEAAYKAAAKYDGNVLVERVITGGEYT